jgi:hypothetical protein
LRHLILVLMLLLTASATADVRTEHFHFRHAPGRAAMAEELAQTAEKVFREVGAQLGALDLEHGLITVRVLHGQKALKQAMPHSSMTDWAAGVAFPRQSLILLRIDHKTRYNIHDIFRHEVSHVLLARAVNQNHLPIWFVEGVAVHQAGEQLLERWRRTAEASLGDSLLPLSQLENGFPGDGLSADLAYAQSTSFITWFLDTWGWRHLRAVIADVRKGTDFAVAMKRLTGRSMAQLEADWREVVQARATWIPILTGTTVLWVIITVLFVWSWLVRRKRARLAIAGMDAGLPDLDDEFA